MVNQVHIDELQPGMVITGIVEQHGPVKIRKSGLVTSADMVLGLAEMGVTRVEIDPSLTVEIEPPELEPPELQHQPTVTATQKLLGDNLRQQQGRQQHHQHYQELDHSLTEQFNRSLFLPSVQGLPSIWQFYARPAALAAVIMLGGGALGWTIATAENWRPALNNASPVSPIAEQPAQPTSNPAEQSPPPASSPAAATDELAAQPAEQIVVTAEPVAQTVSAGQVVQQADTTGEAPVISANLLQKFNQAVAELDSEPVSADYLSQQSLRTDLPRVDQLPTRTMTQLPSMSFSAHMYASDPLNRWVRVNGERLVEGDWLNNDLQLVRIDPQHVILAYRGQEFTMAALSDW